MKPDNRTPVNVKVVVRCRPTDQTDPGTYSLEIRESRREVIVHSKIRRQNEPSAKSYTFDGVCGPNTDQEELFDGQIVPLVEEVLQGFNCTIFAYGQTGTGKTYTMEGEWSKNLGSEPTTPNLPQVSAVPVAGSSAEADRGTGTLTPNSHYNTFKLPKGVGIIPRSVGLIFKRLNMLNCESGLKVSFLEIYNEELIDLLQPAGTEKQTLRIYESGNHLTRGLAVKGLMEVPVATLPEVYNVMANATRKRKTAETLLNRQSSRSHSIFTITVTIKEISSEGEDVIRIGKLNLVDLAGSENIQRSGSSLSQIRTKEACIINQSLVALGRVINSLVSQTGGGTNSGGLSASGQSASSGYIPYRDSKLTRLLQDSLGGHTKTCIIATISSAGIAVEETLSTLDYAYRAKHIKNIPQINQRMSQKFIVKELTVELEKLRKDLLIARERSGEVHLTNEDYTLMEADLTQYQEMKRVHAALESRAEELIGEIEHLREVSAQFDEMKVAYLDLVAEFNELRETHADQAAMLQVEQRLNDVLHNLNTKFSDRIEYYYKTLLSKIENSFQNYDQILKSILRDHSVIIQQIRPSELDQRSKLLLSEYILDSYNKKIPGYRSFLAKEFRKLLGMISTIDSNELCTRVSGASTRCASSFNEALAEFRQRLDNMLRAFAGTVAERVEFILARLDAQKYEMKVLADRNAQLFGKIVEASEIFCDNYRRYADNMESNIFDPGHLADSHRDEEVIDDKLDDAARSATTPSDFYSHLTSQLEQYLETEVKSAVKKIVDENVRRLMMTMQAQRARFDDDSLKPFVQTVQTLNTEQAASLTSCAEFCGEERERAKSQLASFSQADRLKADIICEVGTVEDALKCVIQETFNTIEAGSRECTQLLVKRKGVLEEHVKNKLLPTTEALLAEEDVSKALQQMQIEKQDLNEQLSGSLQSAQAGLMRYMTGARAELVRSHNQLYRNYPAPTLMPPNCDDLDGLRQMLAASPRETGDAQWDEILAQRGSLEATSDRPTLVIADGMQSGMEDPRESLLNFRRSFSVGPDRISGAGRRASSAWQMEEGMAKEAVESTMSDENMSCRPAN